MALQSVQAAARGATSLASQVTPDQLATALYFGAPAAALATGGLSLRTAPSAMDVAQRRHAKDHLEYMLRRRRRDIAEEVEVMDREDPYEKPEDNLDDMDNISTTNFRYSQIPRLQTEIRTTQADLNQVRESLEREGYEFI